ncbi:MAG: hypothetical protein R3F62_00425 [Planctomycetota bacterium]
MGSWAWRDKEPGRHAGLRYEPGNWGDALKGEWALAALEALLARPGTRTALDPFAGAPVYPLAPASQARLEALADACPRYVRAQAAWVARGELTSTAGLLAAQAGARLALSVFDKDPERRGGWEAPATVLEVEDGAQALREARGGAFDLVHVDPYDLQSDWGVLLAPALEALAPEGVLLAYLFNKAPRGAGHQAQYARLRQGLAERLGPARDLRVGRVPADAVLPRAYHEVLLVGPTALCAALDAELRASAEALAATIARAGAYEGQGGGGAGGRS